MAMSASEREAVIGLVGSDIFLRLKDKPGLLKESIGLFADGQSSGASTAQIERSVRSYAANPTPGTLDKQRKVLVCDGMDLPASALDSELDAKELLNFGANVASAGGNWQQVLSDPHTWNMVKQKGKKGGTDEIIKGVVGNSFGVPPGALGRLNLEQVLKGAEFAQFRGLEGAIGKPGFWEDFGKGVPANELDQKWRGVLDAEDKALSEKRDRELRKVAQEIRENLARRELAAARLRKERQEARQHEEAAQKRRARRRRRRRRRAKAPKGRVILGAPEIVRVIETKSVHFKDGSSWDITWYSSGTQSIKITQADGGVYFWRGRITLEQISDNPNLGLVKRVRRTMEEWRRPAQSPQQAGGPLGREQ